MTRPAQHDPAAGAPVAASASEAGLARLLWEMQLTGLLEAAAEYANKRYGVSCLIVDRAHADGSTDITALIGGTATFDLWELDPMVWDEANWAATRLLPVGDICVIRPPKH